MPVRHARHELVDSMIRKTLKGLQNYQESAAVRAEIDTFLSAYFLDVDRRDLHVTTGTACFFHQCERAGMFFAHSFIVGQ